MRIEGTYTFPAPIEQVFSALTHPDILSQVIPGCERLVQLGPANDGHPPVYELRLRRGPGAEVYTLTLTLTSVQEPKHLRADLDGRGPDGPFSGHGLVDLVQKDSQTLAATVWEVKAPVLAGLPAERRTTWNETAERFAVTVRDRVTGALREAAHKPDSVRHLKTPRGRVVILPASAARLAPERQRQLRLAAWIGGGLLVGLAAIAMIVGLARRLTRASDALTLDSGDS